MRNPPRVIQWIERRINLTEIFSLLTMFGLFYAEVDTSKPLAQALREALSKPFPSYARFPRVLGLLVLILFVFEVVTGVLLAFYYQPTPQAAYESVLIIARDVDFGWCVRQVHIWGAQLLVLILMVRLLRFFLQGLYKAPRELVWLSAALLLIVATHLDFTGRFLAWNNEFYWSSVRSMELLFSIPVLGSILAFIVPGVETQSYVLSRFYFLHVLILPFAFWCLLYVSFSGIRRIGLSEIAGEERRSGKRAYLGHLYALLILIAIIFGVVVTLSVLRPVPFGSPVDLFETPGDIRMPWYLLAPYGFVEFLPGWLSLSVRSVCLLVLLLVFVFLPVADRWSPGTPVQRILRRALNILLVLVWIFFTYYGAALDIGG
jgi:quinol-cytochrome oxidoreductase complex cytochrome b subunit